MQEASGTGRWTRQPEYAPPMARAWAAHVATLPEPVRQALSDAEQTAAANGWDVHFWRRGERVGIEFRQAHTSTVRFHEWPTLDVVLPPGQVTP